MVVVFSYRRVDPKGEEVWFVEVQRHGGRVSSRVEW